jgi:hypothetical protein
VLVSTYSSQRRQGDRRGSSHIRGQQTTTATSSNEAILFTVEQKDFQLQYMNLLTSLINLVIFNTRKNTSATALNAEVFTTSNIFFTAFFFLSSFIPTASSFRKVKPYFIPDIKKKHAI